MPKLLLSLTVLLALGTGFASYGAAAPDKPAARPAEKNMLLVYAQLSDRFFRTKALNDIEALAAEVYADERINPCQLSVLLQRLSGRRLTSEEIRAVDYGTRKKMLYQLLGAEIAAAATRADISRTTDRYNDRTTTDGSSTGGGAGCGDSADSCGSYTNFCP
jgi:hypothetical protein